MANRLDRYRAALILAEASFSTDKATAKTFGCSARTISNYRKLLEADKDLQKEYRLALYNKTKEWTKLIPETMKLGIEFVKHKLSNLDTENQVSLDSVINAMEKLNEIEIMNEAVKLKFTKGK